MEALSSAISTTLATNQVDACPMFDAIQKSLYRAFSKGRQDKKENIEVKSDLPLLHRQLHMIGFRV
jgi:hypothetical protein